MQSSIARLEQAVANGRIDRQIAQRITRWIIDPALAEFADDVAALVDADDFDRLVELFWEEIPFGTGGRRGVMGPLGTATINDRTIAESAHGLACHLKETGHLTGRIAVAHDTRHRSLEFARLTATTLAAHGFHVLEFDGHRATPTLSFAVRFLDCVAGVVISASHNPPSDNGFKAYWSHGGQVLPPHDQGIVDCVANSSTIPKLDYDQAVADERISQLGPEIDQAHQHAILDVRTVAANDLELDPNRLKGLYTPLQGVGAISVMPVLKQAGFHSIELFSPQAEPDPDFARVPDQLPNPERHQVFGPAIQAAQKDGLTLVMATDPDADRLAVAAPDDSGHWHVLTGNQLAAILLDHLLRNREHTPDDYVLTTLVTTPLVRILCEEHNVQVVDDLLVGFKHIAGEIETRGPHGFLFGCEESIGYQVGTYCRDKDAAVAALIVADIALELLYDGQGQEGQPGELAQPGQNTLWHRLGQIHDRYGSVDEFQHSVYAHGPTGRQKIDDAMTALRQHPPAELGQHAWQQVKDYLAHETRSLPDNRHDRPLPKPTSDLLIFETHGEDSQDGIAITLAVRPSGTEPKIKFYGFARQIRPGHGNTIDALNQLRIGLDALLEQLI